MGASDDGDKPKGKRKYTHSARSLAQRRTAAWKHGENAATVMAQVVPPCKPSHCPMSDPELKGNCEIRRDLDAQGKTPSRCLVSLAVNENVRDAYLKAIREGDTKGIQELSATMLAGLQMLTADQLQQVMDEGGFAIEQDVYDAEGHARGTRMVENPRGELTLKAMDMLGHTAGQQAITPKAGAERERDKGIAGTLDAMRRRNDLAAASGRNPQ